jgi:hypothetical protein
VPRAKCRELKTISLLFSVALLAECSKLNVFGSKVVKLRAMFKLLLLAFFINPTTSFTVNDSVDPLVTVQYKEGVVKNYSALGAGCDWLIEMDGRLFKPKNLKDSFKKDGLRVKIDFEFSLSLYQCEEMKEKIQEINIHWIEVVAKPSSGDKIKLVPGEQK